MWQGIHPHAREPEYGPDPEKRASSSSAKPQTVDTAYQLLSRQRFPNLSGLEIKPPAQRGDDEFDQPPRDMMKTANG